MVNGELRNSNLYGNRTFLSIVISNKHFKSILNSEIVKMQLSNIYIMKSKICAIHFLRLTFQVYTLTPPFPRFLEVRCYFLFLGILLGTSCETLCDFHFCSHWTSISMATSYIFLANVSFERIQRRFCDCCTSQVPNFRTKNTHLKSPQLLEMTQTL